MTGRYGTTRRGHEIEVEVDNSLILATRLRLFVGGFSADETLSELAGGGHLAVEREGEALVYALPGSLGERETEGS